MRNAVEEVLHPLPGGLHHRRVALLESDFERLLRIFRGFDELACAVLARGQVEACSRLLVELERLLILRNALFEVARLVGLESLQGELEGVLAGPTLGNAAVVRSRCRRVVPGGSGRGGLGGLVPLRANVRGHSGGWQLRVRIQLDRGRKLRFGVVALSELRRYLPEGNVDLRFDGSTAALSKAEREGVRQLLFGRSKATWVVLGHGVLHDLLNGGVLTCVGQARRKKQKNRRREGQELVQGSRRHSGTVHDGRLVMPCESPRVSTKGSSMFRRPR